MIRNGTPSGSMTGSPVSSETRVLPLVAAVCQIRRLVKLLARQTALGLLVLLTAAGGASYTAGGVWHAWSTGRDGDLRARHGEYQLFEQRIYPHRRVAAASGTDGVRQHTVYPPYAFPMYAAFFWAPSFELARGVLHVLSLSALGVLMWYGASQLAFAGRAAAFLGLAVPLVFSGNFTALRVGQFSVICVGLLAWQIILLKKNRSSLAGLCWALAMIKPHIALPFAALFVLRRQWRGLLVGGMSLVALSGFALWWTAVPAPALWSQGVATHKLQFVHEESYGAGLWISALGVEPRLAMLAGLALTGLFALSVLLPFIRERLSLEQAAAVCAVLATALFYHRHYDNLLLVFLLLPLLAGVFRSRSPILVFAASLLLLSVGIHQGIVERVFGDAGWFHWFALLVPPGVLLLWLLLQEEGWKRGGEKLKG